MTGRSGPPTRAANAARNARGGWSRYIRWRAARAALWALLDRYLAGGARLAIVGAGNGDDLPLRRICQRAARVDLIDLDPLALRQARRRCALARATVDTVVEDVTAGAADMIVCRALGDPVGVPLPLPVPVGRAPYDMVIADLFLSQLLYPALVDAGLPGVAVDETTLAHGQPLTDAVVAWLHASAAGGLVVLVHDLLGWWHDHPQPFTLHEVLSLADSDRDAACKLAATGNLPYGCDPCMAAVRAGGEIIDTSFWRWPFAPGTNYLVHATVARAPDREAGPAW